MARARILDDDETKMEFELVLTTDEVLALRCLLGGLNSRVAEEAMLSSYFGDKIRRNTSKYYNALFTDVYNEVDECVNRIPRIFV